MATGLVTSLGIFSSDLLCIHQYAYAPVCGYWRILEILVPIRAWYPICAGPPRISLSHAFKSRVTGLEITVDGFVTELSRCRALAGRSEVCIPAQYSLTLLWNQSLVSQGTDDDHRYSNWVYPVYDPFSSHSGRMSPSDHQELLRSRMPSDLHMAGRGLPRSVPMEPHRPLSFVPGPQTFASEPAAYGQHEFTPRSTQEDSNVAFRRQSQDSYVYQSESPTSRSYSEYEIETHSRRSSDMGRSTPRYHTRRRPFNQDEFDGPSQLLPLPLPQQELARSQDLSSLPTNLNIQEQDEVLQHVNDILSQCAFHFVAKYQFPVPLERDKPRVRTAADREWTEWAYLLKRLATKRRIPARVLFDSQIKQFVTTLENSIAARQNREHQGRTPKDDRYVLQLISAGTQVAKILMDSQAMDQLDNLYKNTETVILERRTRVRAMGFQ